MKIVYNSNMRVCNLASSSDGNCTYIETENTSFLIDAGLSCLEIVTRLQKIGVNPSSLKGIVVSHEHTDHMRGVEVLAKKFNLDIFANVNVWDGLDKKIKRKDAKHCQIIYDDPFEIGGVKIAPVRLSHDVPCYGFVVGEDERKVSIITDLGHTNDAILEKVKGSRLVYLESNYEDELLWKVEKYPLKLKKRIASDSGHLSNLASGEFISKLVLNGTKQVVLSHLSRESNSPEKAFNSVVANLESKGIIEGEHLKIDVASPNVGVIFKLK